MAERDPTPRIDSVEVKEDQMKLKDVMTKQVEVIKSEANLQEAALKMKDLDVGSLPVCDGDRVVGIVTDRDIAIRAVAEGLDPKNTSIKRVMSVDLDYSYEDDDVQEAARLMEQKQIRRLPVMSPDKKLVGIVALGDIAVNQGEDCFAGEILHKVSEPARPRR